MVCAMGETIGVKYICLENTYKRISEKVCIDISFSEYLENKINRILLIRSLNSIPKCTSKPKIVLERKIAIKEILSTYIDLYRELYEETKILQLKHAREVGRKNLLNALFLPFPLRSLWRIEKLIIENSDKRIALYILEELFGKDMLLNEAFPDNISYSIIYGCFQLEDREPYIYIGGKPDPLYKLLFKIDKGFRRKIRELIKSI
jgi:hypothetical protein